MVILPRWGCRPQERFHPWRVAKAGDDLLEVGVSDDKTNKDSHDRDRVAGGETYEVEYFARKHGMSMEQARDLIARVGNDRAKLDAAAENLIGRKGS